MSHSFQIESGRGVPIYRQLMEQITLQIKNGTLPLGARLPTVRELAEREGVARGTVKKTYDELERAKLIEQIQGRGTFVRYAPPDSASRKEQAMKAIDELLDRLEGMEFSMSEIHIFLRLKLQERAARQENVKTAVIECNPEVLSQLTSQLRRLPGIDFYSCLLEQARSSPYRLAEEMDLIVTTVEHAAEVEKMTARQDKLAKVVLRLAPRCAAEIVKLRAGWTVGILCESQRFGRLLWNFCRTYAGELHVPAPRELGSGLEGFLKGKDAVLLPDGYEKYCTGPALEQLRAYGASHPVIPCIYEIDEGSFLYVSERLEELRRRKELA